MYLRLWFNVENKSELALDAWKNKKVLIYNGQKKKLSQYFKTDINLILNNTFLVSLFVTAIIGIRQKIWHSWFIPSLFVQ